MSYGAPPAGPRATARPPTPSTRRRPGTWTCGPTSRRPPSTAARLADGHPLPHPLRVRRPGLLTLQTAADGGTVRNTYTTGAEPAVGGGNTPTGLPLTTTDPRGKITRYQYFSSGDLARISEPSGLVTAFTYDALGRKLTETEISDAHPAGTTTTLAYDKLSRLVSTTEPATTNAVTLARHQQRTVTAYDADGNTVRTEVGDALGGDEPRTMTFESDDRGRPAKAVDAEGNETSYGYDSLGNRTSMVDANGNHFQYVHTARNMMAEVRLRDWDDDGGDPDYTVLQSYAYDMGGRVVRDTDSMGRTVLYDYYGDDLVKSLTLKDFRDPDGTRRDIVVEANTYDGAGNVLTEKAYNGSVVTEYSYDAVGRTRSEVTDPGASPAAPRSPTTWRATSSPPLPAARLQRAVAGERHPRDRPLRVRPGGQRRTGDRRERHRGPHHPLHPRPARPGHLQHRRRRPPDRLRVRRGRPHPVGHRAPGRDGVRRRARHHHPPHHVHRLRHLRRGHRVRRRARQRQPHLLRPAGPLRQGDGPRLPRARSHRNRHPVHRPHVRRPRQRAHRDRPARPDHGIHLRPAEPAPGQGRPVGEGDERARWAYTYTRTGQLLTVTDPTGARAESTYDDLDRPVTTTRIERRPQPGAFTTRNEYDDAGNVVKQTAPGGGVSLYSYDKLGQLLRMTDPAGVVSQYGYDLSGREVRATDGMGRTSAKLYDALGQLRQDSDLTRPTARCARSTTTTTTVGNLASATDPRGRTTRYAYDALGRLSSQTEPVSATESITTSFGYDALGNRTRYTDGRGNQTFYTVNTLGLPESVVEPATARHPAPEDRTWTTAYDALGQPVKVTAPGGVVRERAYDRAGLLTRESGGGAEAATPARTFGYDAVGRTTRASTPEGDNTYAYDDRGSLISAAGPSGEATYAYDSDGQLTSRTDAAGTANFGYARRQLVSATDPLSGGTQTYRYDGSGAIKEIGYGAGQSRSFAYDALGRLDTDTITGSTGGAIASADYGYDADDHLTSKKTTGTAKAGENTYGYDDAGRLTSWTSDGDTTEYRWDKSGNRTGEGEKTAAYDERNRLLSDGDYTYSHTARGTLATRTSSGLTEEFAFDAFDRLTKAGESGTAYTYDALDRVATRNGAEFSYAGFAPDPVKDNNSTYAGALPMNCSPSPRGPATHG